MKMNSLLDAPCIRALYRASQAGVDVELNVRGICALRPGVPGVSDNIEVVSVVGRFLEHSRIYSFERAGEVERVFMGSADLMPRNLYNRIELVVPVEDPRIRAQLLDVLDRCLADNTNAWVLRRRTAPGSAANRTASRERAARADRAARGTGVRALALVASAGRPRAPGARPGRRFTSVLALSSQSLLRSLPERAPGARVRT